MAAPEQAAAAYDVVARDLVTIWESELSALAMDRELQEGALRAIATGAAQMQALLAVWASLHDLAAAGAATGTARAAAGRPGPDAAPRTTPPPIAPDERDAVIDGLAARVAELERRLGDMPGPTGSPGDTAP